MKIKQGVIVAAAILLASPVQTFAIEGLKISLQSSNLVYACPVLSWPSVEGETFIVQGRATLNTNDVWVTLTNSLPAATGTNSTSYYLDCSMQLPAIPIGLGGSDTNPPSGPSGSSSSSSLLVAFEPQQVMAKPADGSAPPVELAIFPFGFDLSNLMIYDPAIGYWVKGSDYNRQDTSSQSSSSTLLAPTGPGPSGPTPDGGTPDSTGFFRVVRTGLHFFGLTNGIVLSGQVKLPIEIGFDGTNTVDGLFVSSGSDAESTGPIPGMEVDDAMTNAGPTAVWDTRQVTNGVYQLYLGCQVDENVPYDSPPVSVTVSNQIWFPDSWNVAGYYIDVQAQTIYSNGSYHVDIYDDQTNNILSLDGPVDGEGFITYSGQRGFLVENFDSNGDQYSSTYYAVAVSTTGAGNGPTPATPPTTNIIWTEFAWPTSGVGWTAFAIAYQPIFGNPVSGGVDAIALQTMIQDVYTSAEARPGLPEQERVKRGSDQNPNELWSQFDYTQLLVPDLRDDLVRNFYYFGHGAPKYIGQKKTAPSKYLDISDLNSVLRNNFKEPLAGTNAHPFRFVYLDGCDTSKGDLCKAFGIPKEQNVARARFVNRGLRLRAFIGWDNKHTIRWGSFNTRHASFVGDFWGGWPGNDPTTSLPRTVRQAHQYAATQKGTTSGWPDAVNHLAIYGYEGLWWQDTLP